MTEREQYQLDELKAAIFEGCNYVCEVCGKKRVTQLAHRIPQRKHYLNKYGSEVIHHRLNLVAVCGLVCNNKVSIGNNTIEIKRLVKDIQEALCKDEIPIERVIFDKLCEDVLDGIDSLNKYKSSTEK